MSSLSDKKADIDAVLSNEIGARLLEHLDLVLLKPQSIIQLGLANANFSKQVQQRYPKTHLTTISTKPYIHQKKFLQKTPRVIQTTFQQLPFSDHTIDLVLANLSLYPADLTHVFNECQRILKPEGLFLFSTFGPDTFIELNEYFSQTLIDMHHIGDLLIKNGFADPVMEMEKISLHYSNLKNLQTDASYFLEKKFLTPKHELSSLSSFPMDITIEVIYGHSWGAVRQKTTASGETQIPLQKLLKRRN